MSTNLFSIDLSLGNDKDLSDSSVAIVVAKWNSHITEALATAAVDHLKKAGLDEENIVVKHVPGTVELTYAAAKLYENFDAVIVIGCVIRGDTPHFDYVCQSVTQGCAQLNAEGLTPVIFCVLTVENEQQALDRAGGALCNKGTEAAQAALDMIAFSNEVEEEF